MLILRNVRGALSLTAAKCYEYNIRIICVLQNDYVLINGQRGLCKSRATNTNIPSGKKNVQKERLGTRVEKLYSSKQSLSDGVGKLYKNVIHFRILARYERLYLYAIHVFVSTLQTTYYFRVEANILTLTVSAKRIFRNISQYTYI